MYKYTSLKNEKESIKEFFFVPTNEIEVSFSQTQLNGERKIIRFFPIGKDWEKKLNSTASFFSCLFPSGALYFKGNINQNRFIEAMQKALKDFHFIFSKFKTEAEGLYVSYVCNDENGHYIQLEVENLNSTLNHTSYNSSLPSIVDERIKGGATDNLESLSMGAFKLTTFKDGFIVGYYLNHAFFDQSSIAYFFIYLAAIYSHEKPSLALESPKLIDLDEVRTGQNYNFDDLENFQKKGSSLMGFNYAPRMVEYPQYLSQFGPLKRLSIHFNPEIIAEIKKESPTKISSNDIIHGALFKINALNPFITRSDNFCLGFPINMRAYIGLGNEVIGNIVSHSKLCINKDKILASSISDLAKANRQCLSRISVDDFMKNLEWYRYFQKQNQVALDYMPIYNFLSCRATNWTNFKYDSILFDDEHPVKLAAPCYAQFGVNVISFESDKKQIFLKTTSYIPSKSFKAIQKLGHETKLFIVDETGI